jgi:hypothetical protein
VLEIQKNQLEKGLPENYLPIEYSIGSDNLPKEQAAVGWGDTFTVYTTYGGEKLHCKCGCSNAKIQKHIFNYYKQNNFQSMLCKVCCKQYSVPDLSWYEAYLEYNSLPNKYESTKKTYTTTCKKLSEQHKKCNSSSQRFFIKFSKKKRDMLKYLNESYYEQNFDE